MKIVAGNSNVPLTISIANYLKVPLVKADIKKFPDKEIFAEIRFDGTLGFTIFDRRQGFEMIADNGMIMG